MTMPETNAALIAEVKAALEKATPGPWRGDRFDGSVKYDVLAGGVESKREVVIHGDDWNCSEYSDTKFGIVNERDEALILNAPSWLRDLADRLEAAERPDVGRLIAQAHAIGAVLRSVGSENVSLAEGVRLLAIRATEAEHDRDEARRQRDDAALQYERGEPDKCDGCESEACPECKGTGNALRPETTETPKENSK
jgi:hypothetical protein